MKKKILLLFLLLTISIFFFTSCSDDFSSNGKVVMLDIALNFKKTDVRNLEGTINDALELGECLKETYERKNIPFRLITMLSDGGYKSSSLYPSKSNVVYILENLNLSEKDLFIFYVSSHGDYSIRKDEGYILLGEERAGYNYSLLSFSELSNILSLLSSEVVLILDTCSSGGFEVPPSSSPFSFFDTFSTAFEGESNSMIALCGSSDITASSYEITITSPSGENEDHGVLTYSLLYSLGWIHDRDTLNYIILDGVRYNFFGRLKEEKEHYAFEDEIDKIQEMCFKENKEQKIKLTKSKYKVYLY